MNRGKMKKVLAILLALATLLVFAGCAKQADAPAADGQTSDVLIGISMPTHSDESWLRHCEFTKDFLRELGYTKFDEQWAEDVPATQVNQIENMITKGAKVLVVASVDGGALTEVLAKAAKQGVKVIAYDRLLMNTPDVDCYVTFDNTKVGEAEAKYIIEKLGLDTGAEGPFNLEIFCGSPDDNNSYYFYDGAIALLQPYIDEGKIVVKSGQFGIEQCGIQNWDGAVAQTRMDNLITAYYSDGSTLDAVLVPYDGLSIGVISSLKNAGYGTADRPLPIVTGQDAEVASVKSIIAGEQAQTVWKDFRKPAEICAQMVDALVKGTEIPVNDTTTYDNGVKVVPAYLCEVDNIDASNYMKLFESGFYDKADDTWAGIVE